jgi:hypothetical protein
MMGGQSIVIISLTSLIKVFEKNNILCISFTSSNFVSHYLKLILQLKFSFLCRAHFTLVGGDDLSMIAIVNLIYNEHG